MKKNHLPIVIVGEVDHGKSTLIGRLLLDTGSLPDKRLSEIKTVCRDLGKSTELAYLTDQLKEERDNNMTIDTAQTFLKTPKASFTLIDAPGHVEFLKNMLTGAALADAAILIIDISQNIQQQTRRHAYLIQMLGIKNIIIALNKIDLVEYREATFTIINNELSGHLHTLGIKPAYIIPISAKEGVNIIRKSKLTQWYKGKTLVQALDAIPKEREQQALPLRLPVQDVYTIDGEKVIVGQITSGQISCGQKITILPSIKNTTVRSIKIFNRSPRKASRGENIGVILADSSGIKRGCIISDAANTPLAIKTFSGKLFWLHSKPLKINDPVTITCATQIINGYVTGIQDKIDPSTMTTVHTSAKVLRTHELATVSFSVEDPLVIEETGAKDSLGRFVITQGARLQGTGTFNRIGQDLAND